MTKEDVLEIAGLIAVIGLLVWVISPPASGADSPPAGIVSPCTITEVYDGDTITVELRLPLRVRLLDCWAPELRDEGGRESRDHLRNLAVGKRGVMYVPFGERFGDSLSFGRVLGHVWIDGQDESLSALQVTGGHATQSR